MRRKSFIIISFLCLWIPWVCAGSNEGVLTSKVVNHPGGTITVEEVSDLVVNLIATPADGYQFLQWSDGETNSTRQHTHTTNEYFGDVEYYAVFVRTNDVQFADGHVEVTVDALELDAPAPTYHLTAVENSDAEFYLWNNAETTNTISYTEEEGTRIPFFVNNAGNLSFAYQNHPGGIVEGKAIGGLNATLTATPNAGYEFFGWSDGETNPTRSYTHSEIAPDASFWAVFKKIEDFTWEDGQVSLAIKDASTPSFTLTATANQNVDFYMWNNAVETPSVDYVEEDGTRVPFFISQLGTVSIFYEQHPGGVVSAEKISNQQFTFTATPNDGYTFVKWSDGETAAERSYTHTAFGTDAYFWAIFTRDEDINVQDGHTQVTITDVTQDELSYSLEAMPDEFAEFYSWSHGVEIATIDYKESDGTRIPSFISSIGTLSLFFDPHAGGIIQAEQISGLTYRYIAIPNEGYSFLSWADGETNPIRVYTHSDVAPDISFLAVFTRDEDVQQAYGFTNVEITNSTTPAFNLTANAAEGASFYVWTNGSDNVTVPYVEEDGNVIPYFINESGELTFAFEQHPGGIISAENVVGLSCDLIATPSLGYRFVQWADGSTNSVRHYTHTANKNTDSIRFAVFEKIDDVDFINGKVTVTVDNPLEPNYTLTAEAYSCVGFDSWINGKTTETISYSESEGQCFPIFSYGDQKILVDVEDETGGFVEVTPGSCEFTLSAIPNNGWSFAYWDDDHSLSATRKVDYVAHEYIAYFAKAAFRVGETYYGIFEDAEKVADLTHPIVLESDVIADVVVTKDVPIDANGHVITNLIIANGATMTFQAPMNVTNLYLNATTGSSSQLKNYDEYLTCTNAYIDIQMEAGKSVASPDKWYAFSVPFEVDVEQGIARASGNGTHSSGTDYLVWEYDGNLRAQTGNGWVKMYGGTLQPGRFYMIGIDGTENSWRFTKKAGADLGGSNEVALDQFPSNDIDKGWNAVGNSTLQYANASIEGIQFVQVYDNPNSRYMVKMTGITSFVVACPFFVQVDGNNTLSLTPNNAATDLYAPARRKSNAIERDLFEVRFGNEDIYDAIFVSASEDATYQYEVGRDLIKMGINSALPTLWTSDYGQMLCVQEAPLENNQAYFALSLSAPKSGIYTLDMTSYSDNANLYLTQNGCVIWNLGMAPYDIDLDRGVNMEYGLLLNKKRGVVTDGSVLGDNDAATMKIIRNSHLYIIHNARTYDAMGAMVK